MGWPRDGNLPLRWGGDPPRPPVQEAAPDTPFPALPSPGGGAADAVLPTGSLTAEGALQWDLRFNVSWLRVKLALQEGLGNCEISGSIRLPEGWRERVSIGFQAPISIFLTPDSCPPCRYLEQISN